MKLFVYGIFLDHNTRKRYGMKSLGYTTIPDYVTEGDYIVRAKKVTGLGFALTGLIVNVPDTFTREDGEEVTNNIERLDALEGGYDRIFVRDIHGEQVQMYVKPRMSGEQYIEEHERALQNAQ